MVQKAGSKAKRYTVMREQLKLCNTTTAAAMTNPSSGQQKRLPRTANKHVDDGAEYFRPPPIRTRARGESTVASSVSSASLRTEILHSNSCDDYLSASASPAPVFVYVDRETSSPGYGGRATGGGDILSAGLDSFKGTSEQEVHDLDSCLDAEPGALSSSGVKIKALEYGKDMVMSAYRAYIDSHHPSNGNGSGFSSSRAEDYEIGNVEIGNVEERYDRTFPVDDDHDYYDPNPGRAASTRRYAPASALVSRVKGGVVMFALMLIPLSIIVIEIIGAVKREYKSNATSGVPEWEAEYMAELDNEVKVFEELHKDHPWEMDKDSRVPLEVPSSAGDGPDSTPDTSNVSRYPDWEAEYRAEHDNENLVQREPSSTGNGPDSAADKDEMNTTGSVVKPTEKKGDTQPPIGPNEPIELYSKAIKKYQPVMYDRSKGWNGRTHKEALVFCEVTAGLALCPYDAVCPEGTSGEPLGGFRDHDAWIPILDDGYKNNEWVQAGARDMCVKYSDKFDDGSGEGGPDWDETATRNIMCCAL